MLFADLRQENLRLRKQVELYRVELELREKATPTELENRWANRWKWCVVMYRQICACVYVIASTSARIRCPDISYRGSCRIQQSVETRVAIAREEQQVTMTDVTTI